MRTFQATPVTPAPLFPARPDDARHGRAVRTRVVAVPVVVAHVPHGVARAVAAAAEALAREVDEAAAVAVVDAAVAVVVHAVPDRIRLVHPQVVAQILVLDVDARVDDGHHDVARVRHHVPARGRADGLQVGPLARVEGVVGHGGGAHGRGGMRAEDAGPPAQPRAVGLRRHARGHGQLAVAARLQRAPAAVRPGRGQARPHAHGDPVVGQGGAVVRRRAAGSRGGQPRRRQQRRRQRQRQRPPRSHRPVQAPDRGVGMAGLLRGARRASPA